MAGRAVLTAARVVERAVSVFVRDGDKRWLSARMDPRFVGNASELGPDLALVFIDDPAFGTDLPPIGLGAVNRDGTTAEEVGDCHAIGYPWFAERPDPDETRETVDAVGVLPTLSGLAGGLLSLTVREAPPQPLPDAGVALSDSPWAGMSGAPVIAGGLDRPSGVVSLNGRPAVDPGRPGAGPRGGAQPTSRCAAQRRTN